MTGNPNAQPNMNFYECIRLREYWNFFLCGEYEPLGLNTENRQNMMQYEGAIMMKKMAMNGKLL